MGKWAQLHVENVLTEKIRSLVQTALQEMKGLEIDPPMSFDSFVEHLDTSNHFVNKLVELMVLETADTRTCSREPDSMHISRHTCNKLQILTTQYHVSERMRSRRLSTRRSEVLPPINTERLPRIPDLSTDTWEDVADDLDQDEEMADPYGEHFPLATGSLAGRYDAYVPDGVDPTTGVPRLRHATPPWEDFFPIPPPPARDSEQPPGGLSFEPRPFRLRSDAISGTSPPSGTMLTRQPSMRRPQRTRTVDFSEWTVRARANARRSQEMRPPRVYAESVADAGTAHPAPHRSGSAALPDFYRDAPSDSDELESYTRLHRALREQASQEFLASASATRRSLLASRLRRGGIPPPENIHSSLTPIHDHLSSMNGLTAPRSILDGSSSSTFHRSPSPLISMFEGTERTADAQRTSPEAIRRSLANARTEPTHLATPRSSTPGSVEAVEGEITPTSAPTGATELA